MDKPEVTAYPQKGATGHQSLCFCCTVHQAPQINRGCCCFIVHVDATSEVQQRLRHKTSIHVSIGAAHPVKAILHFNIQWNNKLSMSDSVGLLKLLMIKIDQIGPIVLL